MRRKIWLLIVLAIVGIMTLLAYILSSAILITLHNTSDNNLAITRVNINGNSISMEPFNLAARSNISISHSGHGSRNKFDIVIRNNSGELSMKSCILEIKGSDSCHVYIHPSYELNCSECYK